MFRNLFGSKKKKSPTKKHSGASRRPFQIETLESRTVMAANITATLTSGVLTVEGTDRNDAIVLRTVKDQITIDGLKTKFAAKTVNSVVINSLGGTDTINLAPLNVGNTAFSKNITINTGAGLDRIEGGPGKSFEAQADSQIVLSSFGVTFNGRSPSWTELNIREQALQQYLDQKLSDGVLDRSDMLGLFNEVKKDGKVSAVEFSDLKAVANNQKLFGTNDYVYVLTRDVVLGNVANRTYAGAALGNLAANSTGAHLDKLVGKWFLGTDRPKASVGSTNFSYTIVNGQLFGESGPQYSDVRQGSVGDCYYVGVLAEIAYRDQNAIRNMFIVNGDGTYTVRFFNNGKADYVTVDSQLPVSQSGRLVFANMGSLASSTSNVLWVALAEKAYAQMNEAGWLRVGLSGNGQNAYQAIAGGLFSQAMKQVTNVNTTNYQMNSKATLTQFVTAFNSGKMIGFATKTSGTQANVVGGHQYVVVGYDAKTQQITLFNPWGVNNGSSKPGLVTMSWSQIQSNCMYWSITA